VLAAALQSDNIILSTGGGIILRPQNRSLLRSVSCVVYLNSSPDCLVSRLVASTDRPLFLAKDPLVRIRTLWSERSDLYLQTAHFTVCVDNKNIQKIAEEVIDAVYSKP
jgi:shikimate kinase